MGRAKEFGRSLAAQGSLSRGGENGDLVDVLCMAGGVQFLHYRLLVGGSFEAPFSALDVVGMQRLIMSLYFQSLVVSPTYGIS